MVHSDDKGLVLPPNIASIQAVIIPIWKDEETKILVLEKARELFNVLNASHPGKIALDEEDTRPGEKHYKWEKKGVPLRIEIGPKDIAEDSVVLVRRDTSQKSKVKSQEISSLTKFLEEIQSNLFNTALERQKSKTKSVDTWEEFKEAIEAGFFVLAHWSGEKEEEDKIKEETKATVRCISLEQKLEEGKCVFSGKPSKGRVIFARSY